METRQSRLGNVLAAFAVAPLGGTLLVAVVGILFGMLTDWGPIMGRIVGWRAS